MANRNGSQNGQPTGATALANAQGLTRDLVQRHVRTAENFWRAVAVFAIMLLLGIIGLVMRISDGVGDRAIWGYYAAMFAFLLTTAQAAPMVAIAPRMAKAQWSRPVSRAAELWSVVGLFNLVLFIPMLWVLPPLSDGRRSLWFFDGDKVNPFSPHIWATVALVSLVILGLALVWVSALPDFAIIRDNAPDGWRRRWSARLARGWRGTSEQWNMQHHRLGILGAFYFMMLIFVHFLISVDFLMTLVPGWIDALFPITHAANALQAGVATMLLTAWVLRQYGGYKDYIGLDQIWSMGKLLFALSLLWFWFWFSSFNILWYGKKPNEQAVIQLLMTGPYLRVFMAVFVLNFLVPMWTMMWNPLRKSLWGPPIIAGSVLIGTFLDRIRLYVAAYSVDGIGVPAIDKHALDIDNLPAAVTPGVADVFIMLGFVGGALLLYFLASRIFPILSIWEQRELLMYKIHKTFHRTEVTILGKPE